MCVQETLASLHTDPHAEALLNQGHEDARLGRMSHFYPAADTPFKTILLARRFGCEQGVHFIVSSQTFDFTHVSQESQQPACRKSGQLMTKPRTGLMASPK